MQQLNQHSTSLLSVPYDVTQHYLLRFLSRPDLVVLSLTCTRMQQIFTKWLCCVESKKISKAEFQSKLMDDIFREGSFGQLVWFQENLKYLSKTTMDQTKQTYIAAKGFFISCILPVLLIFSLSRVLFILLI